MRAKALASRSAEAAWVVLASFFLVAPASGAGDLSDAYHQFVMKGVVIQATASEIYLCIGTADGAEVGEEYDVVRVSHSMTSHPRRKPSFKRKAVGRVRIEEIVETHYARARVLSGKVRKGDLVTRLGKPQG